MGMLRVWREGPLPYRARNGALYQSGHPWRFEGRGVAQGISGFATTFEAALRTGERMVRSRMSREGSRR